MIFQHCTLITQVQHSPMILFELVDSLLLVTNGTTTASLNKGRNDNMALDIDRTTDASDTLEVGAPVTVALDHQMLKVLNLLIMIISVSYIYMVLLMKKLK